MLFKYTTKPLQGSIIGVTLLVANLTFVLVPDAHFTQKTLSLVNSAMNPVLYIIFNGVVRRQVMSCGNADDTKATVGLIFSSLVLSNNTAASR